MTSVDVAAEAGVSQATVARAFSSPDLVSDETRGRVVAAAERLGYVPNAIARSLRSQRTQIVGAVVPAYGEYWQGVLTAFSRQLASRGRQLLLFSFAEPDDVDTTLASVAQYRLDGLILASATIRPSQFGRITVDIPVVAFNQPAAAGVVPSVGVDHEAGMFELAAHLLDQGCRTALYVGGVAAASTDQARYRAAAQRLAEAGVACPYLEAGAYSYEAGHRAGAELARRDELPDAVLVGSDEVAFGVIDALRAAGVDPPEDLLVTGFDGLPQAAWAAYDLTTLVQSTEVLVEAALGLLLDGAGGESGEPASVVVPGTVRHGRTSRRRHG